MAANVNNSNVYIFVMRASSWTVRRFLCFKPAGRLACHACYQLLNAMIHFLTQSSDLIIHYGKPVEWTAEIIQPISVVSFLGLPQWLIWSHDWVRKGIRAFAVYCCSSQELPSSMTPFRGVQVLKVSIEARIQYEWKGWDAKCSIVLHSGNVWNIFKNKICTCLGHRC